uniref:Uncharacterized protein n=1 Tax=Parastrongyloides trichosuri TaxID=131310 RepID=A0A0N4ZEU4_PARTI
MGAQTSKVGRAYKRFFRRKKFRSSKTNYYNNDDENTNLLSINSSGDVLAHHTMTKQMTVICNDNLEELNKMNNLLEAVSSQLKESVDNLIENYKKTLTESKNEISSYLEDIENQNMNVKKYIKKSPGLPEEFKDIQIGIENGRLLYNILAEKMENCDEYLNTFKEFIESTFNKTLSCKEFNDGSSEIVYTCKYFLAVSVTGFWLEITPKGHDDFDEVNGFFYDSLLQYFYALKSSNGIINRKIFMPETFEDTLKEICQQYPNIKKNAGLKKFLKNELRINIQI